MAVGAFTGRRGTAIGAGTAFAAASYLVSSLAPVVSWVHTIRFVSLFYWSVGHNQVTDGATIGDVAVLVAVGVAASYAAVANFRRLDLH
jgi:beta-exotoxin I transport system permease protein